MITSSSDENESKQSRLLLDYEILSSLKKQKIPSVKSTQLSETLLPMQNDLNTSQVQERNNGSNNINNNQNHFSLLSTFNLFNFSSKDNPSDKLFTNNSFYHNDLMNYNSKQISLLSFNNKDFKNTSESFYRNLLPTSYNLKSRFTQEFLQQKREHEIEANEDIHNNDTSLVMNREEQVLFKRKKLNIFIHHKYEKRIQKENVVHYYKCQHPKCDFSSQTHKQKMFHHNKMDKECKNDTIAILKLIKEAKELIGINNKQNMSQKEIKIIENIRERYNSVIKYLSLSDYAQYIAGFDFNNNK